jgi:hypothetical protein
MRSLIRTLAILFAFLAVTPNLFFAQLTTGFLYAAVRGPDGRPAAASIIIIQGAPGFYEAVQANSQGTFSLPLPYGQYQLSLANGRTSAASTITIFIVPIGTTRVDLSLDRSGTLHSSAESAAAGVWADRIRDRHYPEAFSISGALLSLEPAMVTEPLNFTGLADGRLALAAERGFSWTTTQYRFQGLDATDIYQPGRPAILPDVQALDEIIVRSGPSLTTSAAYAAEVDTFLAQPGRRWRGAIGSTGTSSFLSSTNLPPRVDRGLVQQPDRFHWLTRDHLESGGPVTQRADLFVS